MKKVAFIFLLFLLFTGLLLFKKGLLTQDRINYLRERILHFREDSQKENFSQEGIKVSEEEKMIMQILEELEKERENIFKEKERINKLEERLKLQEKELKEKANELSLLRKEIQDYLKKGEAERMAKIKWLAQVYEQMRVEEVAPIIQNLEDELIIEVLSQMDERQVAKILGAMDVKKAAELAQKIGEKMPGEKK